MYKKCEFDLYGKGCFGCVHGRLATDGEQTWDVCMLDEEERAKAKSQCTEESKKR